MDPLRWTAATLAATLLATPCAAHGLEWLCDPVVTHTNGMRLASTTASRSHNVYWRCDPNHLGYCEGGYYSPTHNDLRGLWAREHGRFAPPCTPSRPAGHGVAHSHDGLEHASSESLGALASAGEGDGPGASQPVTNGLPGVGGLLGLGGLGGVAQPAANSVPAAVPAPAEPSWIDAIQTIGEKLAAPPAG